MNKIVKRKIRKGDKVVVISGNSRGKSGNVMRIADERVVIEGINLRKKHVKPTRTTKGGIVDIEMPIHISNVKVCVEGDKPVKLHVKENKEGQRELYYKDGSKEVVYRTLSPKVSVS